MLVVDDHKHGERLTLNKRWDGFNVNVDVGGEQVAEPAKSSQAPHRDFARLCTASLYRYHGRHLCLALANT